MLSVVPLHQGLVALLWLAVVVLLILGASRVARLFPSRLRGGGASAKEVQGALALRGSMALDLRRRVYLVEAAGRSTLILTGGAADLMLALDRAQD